MVGRRSILVLSGFLIGGILLDARGSPNYFRAFYVRRFCRIFPLYLTFLVLALFVSRLSPVRVPWHLCLLFVQNFWMAAHNSSAGGIVDPSWSLAVEEQFYLIIPAVIYFVSPRQLPKVLVGGAILAPVVRVAMFVANQNAGMATMVLLPCRMDALLIGVLSAYVLRIPGMREKIKAQRRHLWAATELLSVPCVASLVLQSTDNLLTNLILYDCFSSLFACLLIASLVDPRLAGFMQMRWLKELGTISYAVYLLHSMAFVVVLSVLPRMRDSGAEAAALGLVLTIGLAKLSWRYFEKPIIGIGHRISYTRDPAAPRLGNLDDSVLDLQP